MFLERDMDKAPPSDPPVSQVDASPSHESRSPLNEEEQHSADTFPFAVVPPRPDLRRNTTLFSLISQADAGHQSDSKSTTSPELLGSTTTSSHASTPSTEAELRFGIAGSTPLPHLPLRKKASKKLRLGLMRTFSRSRKDSPTTPSFEHTLPPELVKNAQQVSEQRVESTTPNVVRRGTNGSATQTDSDRDSIQISPRQSQLYSDGRDRTMSDASSIVPSPTAQSKPIIVFPDAPPPPVSASSRPTTTASVWSDSSSATRMTATSSLPRQSATPSSRTVEDKVETRQSSLTNGSSRYSGDQNSIQTSKRSTIDLSGSNRVSAENKEDGKAAKDEDEMSVEDAIDMYVEGFEDDPEEEEEEIPMVPDVPPMPDTSEVAETKAPDVVEAKEAPQAPEVPELTRSTPTPPPIPPLPSAPESQTRRHSDNFTLAPSVKSVDSLPSPPLSPLPGPGLSRSKTNAVRTSAQIIAGQFFPDSPKSSRPSSPASPRSGGPASRDRYGFTKENRWITLQQYDTWNDEYKLHLERRKKKWIHLMNDVGLPSYKPTEFPAKNDHVKRFIRKGIPPEWRADAWWFYAGGPAALERNPGVYQALVKRSENGEVGDSDREHIERDLNRTFPDNVKFKPDVPATLSPVSLSRSSPSSPLSPDPPSSPTAVETPMIRSLRRVLQAFSLYNPKIGYCQSMNFLAAHILIVMKGNEERSFHMLVILLTEHLPGTHGVALEGANVDIGVLMTSLKEAMPALWAKLDDREEKERAIANADMRKSTGLPTVSLATTAWFMSCFVSVLPVETVCRVWDCLFYEGTKTLFRVALGIFWLGEIEIRRTTDHMEAFQIVQTLPHKLIDANAVLDAAMKSKGLLSQDAVARLRDERRRLYQREREKVMATMPAPGQLPTPPPVPDDAEKEKRARGFLTRMASTASVRTTSTEKEKERGRQRDEDPDNRPLSRGLSRATSRARMRRMKSFKA